MATVLRQEHRHQAGREEHALAAWLAPELIHAGRLYTMERIREPELMDDEAQALAYAQADFNDPHNDYITLFKQTFGERDISGYVLDLGCGPGDITFRFAHEFPDCVVHGLDGSMAMLTHGLQKLESEPDLKERVEFFHGLVPGAALPRDRYEIIISNSLLHHLQKPLVMWQEITRLAAPASRVFIMDLRRPQSQALARKFVDKYTGTEPEILRRDFYNSLLASFKVEEIRKQLGKAGLDHFEVKEVGDRHLIIFGSIT